MKNLTEKLKIIYLPFLLIAIGFISLYTLLHWGLFIKLGIPLKEDIVKLWLPLALPFIPVLWWLKPRIELLQFKSDRSSFFYQICAWICIAAPAIIAQHYLISATGTLSSVDNISELSKSEKTKYYTLKSYYIDKQHVAVENSASVSGRYNEDLTLIIYVAMPIMESIADTGKSEQMYWFGKKYSKRISNRLSDEDKDAQFRQFAEDSEKTFDNTDFSGFDYLEVLGNTEDRDMYKSAISKIVQSPASEYTIFEAREGSFEARSGDTLFWSWASLGIGFLFYFILLLFPDFEEKKLSAYKKGKLKNDNSTREFFEFFIPRKGFYITPILIDINLLLYLLMVLAGLGVMSFKAVDLLAWGANYKPLTAGGQWWRLLTSTFLHGGLMHIVANMYGLVFAGIFLEPLLGKMRFALLYLATGILASVASIWWQDATVSVGASGAIFGLYGFFLASILLKVFPPDFGAAFLASILVFVGVNLLMGFTGGIDNAAHIGGLVSGFMIGVLLSRQLRHQKQPR